MRGDAFLGYAVRVRTSRGPNGGFGFEALFTIDDMRTYSQPATWQDADDATVSVGPLGVGASYDGKERVFNRRGGMLTNADTPVVAGPWPVVKPQKLEIEWCPRYVLNTFADCWRTAYVNSVTIRGNTHSYTRASSSFQAFDRDSAQRTRARDRAREKPV